MKKNKKDLYQKLIDCHTHCVGMDLYNYVNNKLPYSQDIGTLVKTLQDNSIDYAITFPIPNTIFYDADSYLDGFKYKSSGLCKFPFETENGNLLNQVSSFDINNILPFLCFSLNVDILEQIEGLERLVLDYDVYGLKYHSFCDQNNPKNIANNSKLLEFIRKYDLPLLIHSGNDPMVSAANIYELAELLPDIRICAAHVGRFSKDFFDRLAKKALPNLFVDTSPFINLHSRLVLQSNVIDCDQGDAQRALQQVFDLMPFNLIWGTDSPYTSAGLSDTANVVKYEDEARLLRNLDKQVMERIASNNTIDFLFGKE